MAWKVLVSKIYVRSGMFQEPWEMRSLTKVPEKLEVLRGGCVWGRDGIHLSSQIWIILPKPTSQMKYGLIWSKPSLIQFQVHEPFLVTLESSGCLHLWKYFALRASAKSVLGFLRISQASLPSWAKLFEVMFLNPSPPRCNGFSKAPQYIG